MIARLISSLLWRLYAPVYDSICQLVPYQDMLQFIAQTVDQQDQANVLDIGCGTGNATGALKSSGRLPRARYTGFDNSPDMLAHARRKFPQLTIRQGSLEDALPYADGSFDIVVASNLLYLLRDYKQAVGEIFRILRPGGQFIVTTPRHDPDIRAIVREHARRAGIVSLLGHLPALVVVGALNLWIVRNQQFKFFAQELATLLGVPISSVKTSYADQVWLVDARKGV